MSLKNIHFECSQCEKTVYGEQGWFISGPGNRDGFCGFSCLTKWLEEKRASIVKPKKICELSKVAKGKLVPRTKRPSCPECEET